jgi:succinate dehydrogenase / fumarate reductase, cytochrome b subunit
MAAKSNNESKCFQPATVFDLTLLGRYNYLNFVRQHFLHAKPRGNSCTVNTQRPVNLNLFTIKFPIPAIVSILHRLSGLFLFLIIPLMLWTLEFSLSSESNFQTLRDNAATPVAKILILLLLSPFIYHFVAGIRHLLMDMEVAVEKRSGRISAILTFLISFLLIVLAGFYIW